MICNQQQAIVQASIYHLLGQHQKRKHLNSTQQHKEGTFCKWMTHKAAILFTLWIIHFSLLLISKHYPLLHCIIIPTISAGLRGKTVMEPQLVEINSQVATDNCRQASHSYSVYVLFKSSLLWSEAHRLIYLNTRGSSHNLASLLDLSSFSNAHGMPRITSTAFNVVCSM